MNEYLATFVSWVTTFIELWGVLVVLITVIKEIYKTVFVYRMQLSSVVRDETLNHGLANALEILLAAEILKTLIVRTPSQLLEIGALVFIRIFITFILHWEMKHKTSELAHIEKEHELKEKMEEKGIWDKVEKRLMKQ